MLYNEMIPVDTFDSTGTETNFCGQFSEESGLYDTPAGPGGGGGTAPTLPGASASGSSGPLPGLGGGGYTQPSGGGTSWQQYLNPQTIGAGIGLLTSVTGAIGAGKSPDKARIKSVCGRRPLFNIGGKKDKYNACVQNLMTPQPVYQPQQDTGMSSSTKIIIGVVATLVLLAIIITIIMVMKRRAVPVKA